MANSLHGRTRTLTLLALVAAAGTPAAERVTLDVDQVRPGVARYSIVENGVDVGAEIVRTTLADGVLTLHIVATMGEDTYEDAVLRVDAGSGAPLETAVGARFGDVHGIAQYSFAEGRVRGSVSIHGEGKASYRAKPVDQAAPEGVMLRGSAIFLAHAMRIEIGEPLEFPWFSPLQARTEDVRLTATRTEEVEVPFGRFEALRVEQLGGTPGNVFWITTSEPRRLVRVEVDGRPMTIDLVSEEAASPPSAVR